MQHWWRWFFIHLKKVTTTDGKQTNSDESTQLFYPSNTNMTGSSYYTGDMSEYKRNVHHQCCTETELCQRYPVKIKLLQTVMIMVSINIEDQYQSDHRVQSRAGKQDPNQNQDQNEDQSSYSYLTVSPARRDFFPRGGSAWMSITELTWTNDWVTDGSPDWSPACRVRLPVAPYTMSYKFSISIPVLHLWTDLFWLCCWRLLLALALATYPTVLCVSMRTVPSAPGSGIEL